MPKGKELVLFQKVADEISLISDATKMESAIVVFVEQHGDSALKTILEKMNPESLCRLLIDHDCSVPTLAFQVSEPIVVAQALRKLSSVVEPWEKAIVIEDLLISLLLYQEDSRANSILDALIGSYGPGFDFLTLPFLTPRRYTTEALFNRIMEVNPKLAGEILETVNKDNQFESEPVFTELCESLDEELYRQRSSKEEEQIDEVKNDDNDISSLFT